jgi:hypothetical protein
MEDQPGISARIERARQVEKVLYWVGWLVAAVGVAGMAVFTGFWVAGHLDAEQGVTLVLGTTLATVLSGVTAYGAGVNIGLGAERLRLAAGAAGRQPASSGMTPTAEEPGGTPGSGEM